MTDSLYDQVHKFTAWSISPVPIISIYLCLLGVGHVWRSEDNMREASVSFFYPVCPRDWVQAWRQRSPYLLSQVSGPHIPFTPWVLRHPFNIFTHFFSLLLAVCGWSLWTALTHADFPSQRRGCDQEDGGEDSLQVISVLQCDLVTRASFIPKARQWMPDVSVFSPKVL